MSRTPTGEYGEHNQRRTGADQRMGRHGSGKFIAVIGVGVFLTGCGGSSNSSSALKVASTPTQPAALTPTNPPAALTTARPKPATKKANGTPGHPLSSPA